MTTLRFILTGLGNVGRSFLEVLSSRQALLAARYGLVLQAVGVADSSGAAIDRSGLDLAAVIAHKRARGGVARLPAVGVAGVSAPELVDATAAELVLEATPSSHVDGMPGLEVARRALARGMHCVLASKGPLVRAFAELAARSDLAGPPEAPMLRFSGAVGGALPSINLGRRDLAGGRISRVEGVLNRTTQLVLGLRARGYSAEAALAEARRIGVAEPDAAADLEGWDAACKLVIVANAVLGERAGLGDVAVTGIGGVGDEELRAALAAGGRISLLAVAEARAEGYALRVAPTALAAGHPLARLGLDEMGIVYESDVFGRTTASSLEDGTLGTAAAMLRDVVEIAVSRRSRGA